MAMCLTLGSAPAAPGAGAGARVLLLPVAGVLRCGRSGNEIHSHFAVLLFPFTAGLPLRARGAVPPDAQAVLDGRESVLPADLLLELLQRVVLELDDPPAADAFQVVVVVVTPGMLVAGAAPARRVSLMIPLRTKSGSVR